MENVSQHINSLFDIIILEQEKKSKKLIENVISSIKSLGIELSDPEKFDTYLMHKFNKGMREVVKSINNSGIDKVNFVYINYNFLKNNIKNICILKEGGSCSSDKTRAIIKMYLNYLLTGEVNEFNGSNLYWVPRFGKAIQWINLCDGLYDLYYGKTELYLKAYNELISLELLKYKCTLHTWYIEFKDKQVIEFDHTWDREIINPLSDEFFDKGDFYIINLKYVKDRNYEIYKDEELINDYCKVPKSDIFKIYKISKEIMV